MTRRLSAVLCALGAQAFASAQNQPTITIAAAAAAPLSATLGSVQQTATLATGPLAVPGGVQAIAGNAANDIALAAVRWNTTGAAVFLDAEAFVTGLTPGQASGGPYVFLVSISAPSPTPIAFQLTRHVAGTPGNAIPRTRVDVRDDGTFELDETTPAQVQANAIVGPTPLPIRCVLDAAVVGIGGVVASLQILATPGNAEIYPLLQGCYGGGYVVVPRFDGNLDYWVNTMHSGIAVAVFGLDTQPLFLGAQSPGPFSPLLPCVLLPRPDFVAVLPSLAPQTLVIPPAARPVALYSQAVLIDSSGLWTSLAHRIYAY
jgi:hypothetical protein